MKAIRELLRDRRRSQRGSILSGVLIMTAFIAIISGALMTELTGNLLLSRNLMARLDDQATVNSAAELSISRLQGEPLAAGCPALSPTTINGLTAMPNLVSCFPVVDSRSPQIVSIASGTTFNADGTHVSVPRAGLNAYVVGDSSGNVYQFSFGSRFANWSLHLPGAVTAAPTVAPDLGESDANDLLTLVPLSASSDPPSGCQAGGCVAFLASDFTSSPDASCLMPANGPVVSQPAVGVNNPSVALFGDSAGYVFAYQATENANCAALVTSTSVGQPIVAGPIVFAGPDNGGSETDEVYVVTSDGAASWLIRFAFTTKNGHPPQLAEAASLQLPFPNAIGLAADGASLPARLAIGFAGGGLAVAGITASYGMQVVAQSQLPSAESDAPYWCHCPGGIDQIGVGTTDGALYLLDPALGIQAVLPAGGPAISTSPGTDAVGDWFYGGSDGYVHEVQQAQGALVPVASFGSASAGVSSAVQVGPCPTGICVYLGAGSRAYLVPLDARDAVVTACISTAPPACSGANPRLWANLEVGAAGRPQTVHVKGWSYYSG